VIRIATLDEFDPKEVAKFRDGLYASFGVGCEHAGPVEMPGGFEEPLDAPRLLAALPAVQSYPDDKILYLTSRKLQDRTFLTGKAPTHGYAQFGKDRALLSIAGSKGLGEDLKWATRQAMHQLGRLWELHHCLDPRCAMYPTWTPSFPTGDSTFDNFCREKSEQRIRLSKS
jgi:archaemetzincin